MHESHASDAPQMLQLRLAQLSLEAEAATRIHDRTVWIGYAGIFYLLPFLVLLFRFHMQAWHYYLAGALFLAGIVGFLALELAAMARRDRAIEAARRAQEEFEAARAEGRHQPAHSCERQP
jgi:hypothetical protein